MSVISSRLYVICDAEVCRTAGWAPQEFAQACLDGGARLIQVRAKHLGSSGFLDLATDIVTRAGQYQAVVIVNDRADLAALSGAHGVHVGQHDLPPSSVRTIVGPGILVGLSTHTVSELTEALGAPIDYVAVGPVFGTVTKVTSHSPVGLAHVSVAARAAGALPVVAIGGINVANAAATIGAGAAAVAIISDLLATGDPTRRVREYLAALE